MDKNILITKSFKTNHFYNKAIFETINFKVIPSLGSLLEGWLLVVPKRHYISIGQLNDEFLYEELNLLIEAVTGIIKKEYGTFIIFEHGAIKDNTLIGCGVDYAHLHIVPLNINLNVLTTICINNFVWQTIPSISYSKYYYTNRLPYLFFQNSNNQSFIGSSEQIPSQLFRKLIAEKLGLKDKYNWKENYFLEIINNTIQRLEKYPVNILQNKSFTHARANK